ncbi:hypothetical protein Bca101_100262 [Brassica carinata]
MPPSKFIRFSHLLITMEPTGNSTVSGERKPIKKTVATSTTAKPNGKSTASSATVMKPSETTAVSCANSMNPNAFTALSSAHGDQVMLFRDVTLGPREAELVFRLIHFWEARNPNTKILIGQEMLLIDEELVDGQTITDHTALDEADIARKRHLCVHVQTHDGPVMKLYLWDKAATDFCQKFKSYGSTPSVLLVTTVNPKHLGGTLALSTMSSSRVFMDADVQPSKEYLELSSNSEIANRIAADVVTKPEPVTLEELFSYIRQEASKVTWFECTATIDDVLQGSAWYYISCGGCNSKAVKGPTSLICNNKKYVKSEVTGVAQYLTRISVYDKSEQAVFVILDDAGKELTGKHAAELVANYFETNGGVGVDNCVPVPQALLDTIGQTRKFIVKVSDHNLTAKTQTITVTKILTLEVPLPLSSDGISKTVSDESGPSNVFEDAVGDRARKASEILESNETKRSKSG